MDKPLVSVIMITYGHEKYIEEAINGVFIQQTDFPVELIIANDCSPDNSDEVIKKVIAITPENITVRYTRHKENKGMNENFLWAVSQCQGKYIALCEGDDYWTDPLKLQKQVGFLEENPDYGLVHTNYDIYLERENLFIKRNAQIRKDENHYFYETGDLRTLTSLFRAEYVKKMQELNGQAFMKKPPAVDRILFMLIAKNSLICFMNFNSGVYRISVNDSASNFKDPHRKISFLRDMAELNVQLFEYFELDQYKRKFQKRLIYFNSLILYKRNFFKMFYVLFRNNLGIFIFKQYLSYLVKR